MCKKREPHVRSRLSSICIVLLDKSQRERASASIHISNTAIASERRFIICVDIFMVPHLADYLEHHKGRSNRTLSTLRWSGPPENRLIKHILLPIAQHNLCPDLSQETNIHPTRAIRQWRTIWYTITNWPFGDLDAALSSGWYICWLRAVWMHRQICTHHTSIFSF